MKLFEISLALKRNVTNTWVKCKTNLLKVFQENAAEIQRKKLEYITWKILGWASSWKVVVESCVALLHFRIILTHLDTVCVLNTLFNCLTVVWMWFIKFPSLKERIVQILGSIASCDAITHDSIRIFTESFSKYIMCYINVYYISYRTYYIHEFHWHCNETRLSDLYSSNLTILYKNYNIFDAAIYVFRRDRKNT